MSLVNFIRTRNDGNCFSKAKLTIFDALLHKFDIWYIQYQQKDAFDENLLLLSFFFKASESYASPMQMTYSSHFTQNHKAVQLTLHNNQSRFI